MANAPTLKVDSPVGPLEWVIITGEGKEDLQGNKKYQASVVLNSEQAEKFRKEVIDPFWAANAPKGIKEPKSIGLYPHTEATGEKDEDGDNIYEETGNFVLVFKTGTTYADGNPKKIPVFNAKGAEVDLGQQSIGNGSRGRLQGLMALYTVGAGKKTTDAGVTFYLNGVQLSKFLPYVGGPSFDVIEDEEGEEFEGASDMGGIPDEDQPAPQEKVRL